MPQPPPPQSPDPGTSPEQAGRTGGTPPQGAPPLSRPTPPSGTPGARAPQESGPYPARPPAPGYGPRPGYVPPQGYGPAGQGAGPTYGAGYGPTRAYGPGPTGPQPTGPQPGPPWTGAQPTHAYGAPAQGAHHQATGSSAITVATAEPKKKGGGDLGLNKLAAGAGAAATSAVLGSFFGDMGTVTGAAVGSVFSAIATAAYQHSLDKTRDTVKAKIKLPGGRTVDVEGKTEVPAPPVAPGGETGQARVYVTPGDRPTEVISAVPGTGALPATGAVAVGPPKSRRRLLLMTGFAVVVFALGMLAITGIELVKGSPISNASSSSTSGRSGGTSLGGVLGGDSGAASTESTDESETTSPTETDEPTDEDETVAPTADEDADPTAERNRSGADDEEPPTSRGARVTPTPTPDSDANSDAGTGGTDGQSGGGAENPDDQQ